jgi:hypothetical protein
LETIFSPQFTAIDLVNLGFAQIYLTLMIDGIGSKPFSAMTLPPIERAPISHHDAIIASSRAEFSHTRAKVEEAIKLWHEPIRRPAQTGHGPGGEGRKKEQSRPLAPSRERATVAPQQQGAMDRGTNGNGKKFLERLPRPQKAEKQEDRREEKKGRDLSDLRAVLRSISKQDISGTKEPIQGPQKAEEQGKTEKKGQKGEEDGSATLRNALKEALAEKDHSRSTPHPPQKSEPAPAPLAKEERSGPVARPSEQIERPPEPRKRVTPEELERMLRLTRNDLPPFSRT